MFSPGSVFALQCVATSKVKPENLVLLRTVVVVAADVVVVVVSIVVVVVVSFVVVVVSFVVDSVFVITVFYVVLIV